MQKLDMMISWRYSQYTDITQIFVEIKQAHPEYDTIINTAVYESITIGTPADHPNSIYTSVQEWIDTNYDSGASTILGYANMKFGDIFELGDMIYTDQNVDDSIQTKQDKHDNLTALSAVTLASGKVPYATGPTSMSVFQTSSFIRILMNTTDGSALTDAMVDGTTNKVYTATEKIKLASLSDQVQPDWNAISGLGMIANKPSIPSTARTTSALSLSLVGTGATGTQISSTKDSAVKFTVSTSTTSTIGGPATSVVLLKMCSTNDLTEGNWTTVATFESDQTVTLAVALQCVQVVKGQICADVPAGWYVKLVNSGSGTHSESFVSGQKTIFG